MRRANTYALLTGGKMIALSAAFFGLELKEVGAGTDFLDPANTQ